MMAELTLTEANQIVADVVNGQIPRIDTPEARAFLQEVLPELQQMAADGITIDIPAEWEVSLGDDLRHDGYYGDNGAGIDILHGD